MDTADPDNDSDPIDAEGVELGQSSTDEPFAIHLGQPAAFISGPEEDDESPAAVLLRRDSAEQRAQNPGTSVQGCIATVGCGCGQPFVMDLVTDNLKTCPGCGARFTSLLVVAHINDDQILGDVLEHLRLVNEGLPPDGGDLEPEPPEPPAGIPEAN
jgi:hypothetical protein